MCSSRGSLPPSSSAEISTADTTRMPSCVPAASASETPATVSWSLSAINCTPAWAAAAITSAGSSVPSERVEWDWRSNRGLGVMGLLGLVCGYDRCGEQEAGRIALERRLRASGGAYVMGAMQRRIELRRRSGAPQTPDSGNDAAERTDRLLGRLAARDWDVISGIDPRHGVDHVLVGPAGVFAITSRMPAGVCAARVKD